MLELQVHLKLALDLKDLKVSYLRFLLMIELTHLCVLDRKVHLKFLVMTESTHLCVWNLMAYINFRLANLAR